MKLVKHCHEVDSAKSGAAQGALLGMVTDSRLEVTHAFPYPSEKCDSVDDEDYQLKMMRR